MMADRLLLRVYTPERTLADCPVHEVTVPTVDGEIGVLPDHAALVTALASGPLWYRDDAGIKRLRVRGGFTEVVENVVTVLADAGEVEGS